MNKKQTIKSRKRGIQLNSALVRAYAKNLGLTTFAQFEHRVFASLDIQSATNSIANNAWYGKNLDGNRAKQIAQFFGFGDDYTQLQLPVTPSWLKLLDKYVAQQPFIEFVPASTAKIDFIDYGFDDDIEGAIPHQVNRKWRLALTGEVGESVFIIVRSRLNCYLLAPISEPHYENIFTEEHLIYPQKDIRFIDSDQLGWREFIAVKTKNIPFASRTREQLMNISQLELELFANQLLQNEQTKIEVSSIVVVLEP